MVKRRSSSTSSGSLLSCFPFAVGHGQEGVCLNVNLGPHGVLLDCGLEDVTPLQSCVGPSLQGVVCSHAHHDHSRGLESFHRHWPEIPVYASEVTARLLGLEFCRPLAWRSPLALAENLDLELIPAGHLPGAALTLLTYHSQERTYRILYTGDFSLSHLQLVEGLSLETLRGLAPDILISESSLGARRLPHRRQQEKHLVQIIDQALSQGQSVLIPTPAIGLGQEILKLLRSHHQFTGRNVDLWAGESLARVCDLYNELLPSLPLAVQNFAKHQPLFWDDRVYPRLRPLHSKDLIHFGDRPVIVVGEEWSNILKSSPQIHWAVLACEDICEFHKNTAPDWETLRALTNVEVIPYTLADHSDGRNTTQLIHNLRPQHIIFVHGSAGDISSLISLEELQSRYQLHAPNPGKRLDLPLGENYIHPPTPTPVVYEGEVSEQNTQIHLSFEDSISQDPRWQAFADTGLVEARWQGEELLLRGISQRELLKHRNLENRLNDLDCCQNCRHYRQQRCWSPSSPLAGFRVTPEGHCPVFEATG